MNQDIDRRPALFLVAVALASFNFAGCVSTPDEIRSTEPAMTATFDRQAETVHECLARAWENTRMFRFDPPVRVQARYAEKRGSIAVETLEQLGITSWMIDVADVAGGGSKAAAWAQRMVHVDMQAELAARMSANVQKCGGSVTSNRVAAPTGRPAMP